MIDFDGEWFFECGLVCGFVVFCECEVVDVDVDGYCFIGWNWNGFEVVEFVDGLVVVCVWGLDVCLYYFVICLVGDVFDCDFDVVFVDEFCVVVFECCVG